MKKTYEAPRVTVQGTLVQGTQSAAGSFMKTDWPYTENGKYQEYPPPPVE